jgi:hypothetical protein
MGWSSVSAGCGCGAVVESTAVSAAVVAVAADATVVASADGVGGEAGGVFLGSVRCRFAGGLRSSMDYAFVFLLEFFGDHSLFPPLKCCSACEIKAYTETA